MVVSITEQYIVHKLITFVANHTRYTNKCKQQLNGISHAFCVHVVKVEQVLYT